MSQTTQAAAATTGARVKKLTLMGIEATTKFIARYGATEDVSYQQSKLAELKLTAIDLGATAEEIFLAETGRLEMDSWEVSK